MTREETIKILAVLRAAYPRFYAGMGKAELENIVSLWQGSFAEPYSMVSASVKILIESDEKGFPPVIGQVKAKIRLLTQREDMTEAEAWSMVSKAVRNGLYGSAEEFDKLPPPLQKLVGSPSQLRERAMMDSETVNSVVASNFQRSYKVIAAREAEVAKLPEDVRQLVGLLGGSMSDSERGPARLAGRTETEGEALEKLEAERRAYWEKMRQKEKSKKCSREEIIAALRGEVKE